jgi:peptidyl-prolyl cis-trans isomerase C
MKRIMMTQLRRLNIPLVAGLIAFGLLVFGFIAFSFLNRAQDKLPVGAVAIVNGAAIPEAWLNQNIKAKVAQGQKDTPELRLAIKDELTNRTLLAQESARLGLDKTPEAQAQLAQIQQAVLMELLLNDYLEKHPLTDADIKAAYDKQIAELVDMQQYKLSLITLSNEAEASAVLARISKGEAFADLAKTKSTDPSSKDGGSLGWLLPMQVTPVISAVMANIPKGGFSAVPIQTLSGWNIIKVDDKRPFKAPSLEESKDQVRSALIQKQRMEYLKKLRDAARIVS